MCDERTYDLIFSMYDDVIKATRGFSSCTASTDEVYYAGICAKCGKPYTPENRSLRWIEFAQRARDFSRRETGRCWLGRIPGAACPHRLLPPDLINGLCRKTRAASGRKEARHSRPDLYPHAG